MPLTHVYPVHDRSISWLVNNSKHKFFEVVMYIVEPINKYLQFLMLNKLKATVNEEDKRL